MQSLDATLVATGGQPPYTWSEATGSHLPDGLQLQDGVVSGFVDKAGDYTFTLTVRDAAGATQTVDIHWTCDPLFEIDAAAFPQNPVLGDAYQHQFRALGGVAPYTFSDAGSNLPRGLRFVARQALLVGTPEDGVGQRYSVTLHATDARGRTDQVRFRFEIDRPDEPEAQVVRRTDPTITDPLSSRASALEPRGPVDRAQPGEIVGWQSAEAARVHQQLAGLNARGCALMRAVAQADAAGDKRAADEKFAAAKEAFFDMLRIDGGSTLALYNLACLCSLQNSLIEAMDWLDEAIKYGYADYAAIKSDHDLDHIRQLSQFKELLADPTTLQHKAAEGNLERLKAQFPPEKGYIHRIDEANKFIFATNQSPDVLDMLTDRIVRYAKAQYRDLLPSKPDYYIMIVLPSADDFARLRPSPNYGGWYNPGQRLLICGNIGFVLTHEFTHALHFADLERRLKDTFAHKIWFLEGMATLFEDSKLPETDTDKVIPVPNGRLRIIQAAVAMNRAFPWETYMAWGRDPFMDPANVSVSYAQARYMTWWLNEQGKLKAFYEAYSATCRQGDRGAAGIVAMEQVIGKPLAACEAEWKQWVRTLAPVKAQSSTWLGVQFGRAASSTGLAVEGVEADSPAAKAGIQKGDIIVQCDNRAIDSAANLTAALASFEPGDIVRIMVIRTSEDPDSGAARQYPMMLAVRLTGRPK
ncbi:MAG: putative Ig domain-containing protein, partial [Planctomycetota bacterium]